MAAQKYCWLLKNGPAFKEVWVSGMGKIEIFFSILFTSRTIPVLFSPFKLKMNEITGAELL